MSRPKKDAEEAQQTTDEVKEQGAKALEQPSVGVEDPDGTPKSGLESAPAVAGAEQVQELVDKQHDQGFRGVSGDPTPNEHYTVAGVIAGKPTPETDEDHAEWVRSEQRKRLAGK